MQRRHTCPSALESSHALLFTGILQHLQCKEALHLLCRAKRHGKLMRCCKRTHAGNSRDAPATASDTRHWKGPTSFTPKLMSWASRMPLEVASWNMLFSAPRYCGGPISDRNTGTACVQNDQVLMQPGRAHLRLPGVPSEKEQGKFINSGHLTYVHAVHSAMGVQCIAHIASS